MSLGSAGRQVVETPIHGDGLNLKAADPAGPGEAMPPGGPTTGGMTAHEMPFFGRGSDQVTMTLHGAG